MLGVISGEPEIGDSLPAVVGSLADGANHYCKVCGVQLYESVIDLIIQITSTAFGNFYGWNSRISVPMDHSDLDFASVIIFMQAMRDPQNVR